MTASTLIGTRRAVATAALGFLALSQLVIGGWALAAPAGFYATFPASGHAWVALLPPYNEHLVRDVGALSLALAVLLTAAAITADRLMVRVAAGAFSVYAVPHTLFHGLHLHGFTVVDAAAQMGGFLIQIVLVIITVLATIPPSRQHP
ncbi:MAG TPA: hypothetical protein VFU98_16050 [Microlunatus sp.]|nr:hypothetical protein [Microlunatus sp.]